MTCIAGVVDGNEVLIGGDSAGVRSDYGLRVRNDRKVFTNSAFVFGFTTSFRIGQLLAFGFDPPRPPDDANDLMRFMVVDFINAIRTRLKEGGVVKVSDQVESGGDFLVGVHGRLFHVYTDFQVGEAAHGFDACGSGDMLALGSLHSTIGRPAQERVLAALQAAEAFNAGVRGPFVFERSPAKPQPQRLPTRRSRRRSGRA
jgi:hypothetical protein